MTRHVLPCAGPEGRLAPSLRADTQADALPMLRQEHADCDHSAAGRLWEAAGNPPTTQVVSDYSVEGDGAGEPEREHSPPPAAAQAPVPRSLATRRHFDFVEVGTSDWGTLTQFC